MELNDTNVNTVLDEIRPYVEMDGGYLEFVAIDYLKEGPIVNGPAIAPMLSNTFSALPTVRSTSLVSTPGDNCGVAMFLPVILSLSRNY